MGKRRAIATIVLCGFGTAAAMCTPYGGATQSTTDGEGGSASDASFAVDTAMADGATSTTDSSLVDDSGKASGFDASACMVQWSETFETGLPATQPWGAPDAAGSNSALTSDSAMGAPPSTKSIKAHIDLGASTTGHAWIAADTTLPKGSATNIVVQFSVYLGDAFSQSGFYTEMGCVVNVGGDYLLFTHENSGMFRAGYGSASQQLPGVVAPKQWMDVRYFIQGFGGGPAVISVSVKAHDADAAAWQTVSLGGLMFNTTPVVTTQCGVYYAESSTNKPSIDVWVDDVSLSTCP